MSKQRELYPRPNNASDDAMNEFLSAFGVSAQDDSQNTPPSVDNVPDNGVPANNDAPPVDANPPEGTDDNLPEGEGQDDDPQDPPAIPVRRQPDNKQAQAFAQMRIENRNMQNLLKGVAQVLGVNNLNDPNSLTQALQEKILTAQAKQQNLPPEVMQELDYLKQRDRERVEKELEVKADEGFQLLAENFGLDSNQLQAYADELLTDGINPWEQDVDLVGVYILRNYNNLITQAEERGAQREAQRAANALNHSSQPNDKNGQLIPEQGKVNSVSDLDAFFANNGAK